MRILIPCPKDYITSKQRNPFVLVIYKGLIENGYSVVCDNAELWKEGFDYDAVFFQWPEAVFNWEDFNVANFKSILLALKERNVKIIATCHNLHAHSNNKEANNLYDILYSNANVIHHLGDYSYSLFKKKYPNCKHFVSQHPIYYDIKSLKLDKTECRRKLGLPVNKKIILAFGAFRNDEEVSLLISLRKKISSKKVAIVAPRLPIGRLNNGLNFIKTIKCIYWRTYCHYKTIIYNKEFVEENLIPYYLTACDIVFIQRKEILNSGNLPLAFSAGRIVVGPNKGNVGVILNNCNNPSFNPNDTEDVIRKTELGLKMSITNIIGINNYTYSKNHMQPHDTNKIISNQLMCSLMSTKI